MATYTVTINERTKAGKSLVGYLRSLGVINEPNAATLSSVEEIKNVFHKQLLTYLKIANKHLGILVNFNTDDINSNIIRKIL